MKTKFLKHAGEATLAASLVLALNTAASAQSLSNFEAPQTANSCERVGAEFSKHVTTRQNQKICVPIDCDTLGTERKLTIEFIKQFGIWGHIENETNPARALSHLRLHGLDEHPIKDAASECFENYR